MAYNYGRRVNKAVKAVDKRYNNYQKAYNKQVNRQRNADIKASNAQYDANAQSAALRNAVSQRELQRSMYRNGITGGASETSMMNAANNYANQQGVIAGNKAAAANKIRQQAVADKAAYRLQNMQARATAIDSAKDREYNKYQNYLTRKDNKEQKRYDRKIDKYNRYAQTVSGYDTVKAINKKMKQIKKSGKGTWRLAYLRAQKANVRARDYERKHSK